VSIEQAFFFIDREAVKESSSSSFLTIDLKETLTMNQGLTVLFVGGPSPAVAAPGFSNFKGSTDNIRVWWPSCPHKDDPSKCNPFAFLYPKLMKGEERQPSSGIQDGDVQMAHVARPVLDAMFSSKVADSAADGLLVAVIFEGTNSVDYVDIEKSLLVDNVANETIEQLPGIDSEDWPPVCQGCDKQCSSWNCDNFDIECIPRALESGDWKLYYYAETGTCTCADVASCPTWTGCILSDEGGESPPPPPDDGGGGGDYYGSDSESGGRRKKYRMGKGGGRREGQENDPIECTADYRTDGLSLTPSSNCVEECPLTKMNAKGETVQVASVRQSKIIDSLPTMQVSTLSATTKVSEAQALMGCGVSDGMQTMIPQPGPSVPCNNTPTCSTFAGKLGSLLRVDLDSGADLAVGVNVELDLDDSIVRRRGGCYKYDSMNLTICLRGNAGLYKFNTSAQRWEKDALVYPWEAGVGFGDLNINWDSGIDMEELMAAVKITSTTSREFETLSGIFHHTDLNDDLVIDRDEYKRLSSKVSTTNVKSSSTWAALATQPCCDYEGTGAACGDKIVHYPWIEYGSELKVRILLGAGVFSGKPDIRLTDRPAFKSVADVLASMDFGPMPKPMKLLAGWRQLCTSQIGNQQLPTCEGNVASLDWMTARFGHAVQAVGLSTVLLYGGMGCKPSLGFNRVNALSLQAPEARSYAGLAKRGNTLYMFGGFSKGEGKSDL
jgi:hypothetical protein